MVIKMKRGTDHEWTVVKYKDNMFYMAQCKCGYMFLCSNFDAEERRVLLHPEWLYNYCPVCGARKLRYNPEPIKLDQSWLDE